MSAKAPYLIMLEGSPGSVTQIDLNGNRWPQGFQDLIVDGQRGDFQVVTDQEPEADDQNERPWSPGGLDENNARSNRGTRFFTKGDRFQDAAKGALTLYFMEAGAASNTARYVVGNVVRIASDDSEGPNAAGQMPYPNAPLKLQYAVIVAISTAGNSITINEPLRHTHTNDVRDYPTDWGGTGLPRITSLDRTAADGHDGYTYLRYFELRNINVRRPTNGGIGYLITPALEQVLDNCDIGIYWQPSQSGRVVARNSTFRLGAEFDKELLYGLLENCEFIAIPTNGRWQLLVVVGSRFRTNYSPAGRVQAYTNSLFTAGIQVENGQTITAYGSLFPQPGHKPVDSIALKAGQTFQTTAGNTAPGHIEYAPHDFYTVEVTDGTNDLLIPGALTPGSVPPGQDFYRQTCEGMAISTVDGSKQGAITRRFWRELTQRWHYQHTGPKFEVGDKLVYSYVRNFYDGGNHTLDAKRLFHQNSARFQGNLGIAGSYNFHQSQRDLPSTGNRQIPFFGSLYELTFEVLVAGPAGSFLEVSNYPMASKPDGSTSRRIARIDLSQVGTRTITMTTSSGAVGTDDLRPAGLGWVESLDCYWPSHEGQFIFSGSWTNRETDVEHHEQPPNNGFPYTLPFPLGNVFEEQFEDQFGGTYTDIYRDTY